MGSVPELVSSGFVIPMKEFLKSVANWLLWFHLLRVPLLMSLLGAALPVFVIMDIGPSPLVRGAYETGAIGFGSIVLVLGFIVAACFENTWLITNYGPRQFEIDKDKFPVPRLLPMVVKVFYFVGPVATVIACLYLRAQMPDLIRWLPEEKPSPPDSWFAYVIAGMVGAAPAIYFHQLAKSSTKPQRPIQQGSFLDELLRVLGPGFVHVRDGQRSLARGHVGALAFCTGSTIAFAIFGLLPARLFPAGLYVLMVLLALCWIFSWFTFVLDRHRISLILLVAAWLLVGPNLWRGDYTYETIPVENRMQTPTDLPDAAMVIGEKGADGMLALRKGTVCVSAVGGGIHSGSWEVEVLTRLGEINGCAGLPDQIRLLSGTSGGAYGAMLYAQGMYPASERVSGEAVRLVTQTSSLSSVVGGLTYHDLLGYGIPVLWGKDRGRTMEAAWADNAAPAYGRDTLRTATLWDWSQNLRTGKMPAVFFTSGTTESGRPIVYGTSKVADWNFNVRQTHLPDGGEQFPLLTTPVTTGARLSATFPFVSPASRPDPKQKTRRAEHQLDGGYYDNYGIVALNAWLDEGLSRIFPAQDTAVVPEGSRGTILVIQIRYKQHLAEPVTGKPGFFFQIAAPLLGLYNSRTAGQQLRSDAFFSEFARYWKMRGVNVENAAFEFHGDPPLSWHLTQRERATMTAQGEAIVSQQKQYEAGVQKVQALPEEERAKALRELEHQLPLGSAADRAKRFLAQK